MKDHVRSTIEDLKTRCAHAEKQAAEIKQTIRVLLELEGVPIVPLPAEIVPPGPVPPPGYDESLHRSFRPAKGKLIKARPVKNKAENSASAASTNNVKPLRPVRRYPLRKGRRFKGIKEVRTKTGVKYEAEYWSAQGKKSVRLGTFAGELEAAMKVAEALNDAAEIERINGLIRQRADDDEQRQNSPDRGEDPPESELASLGGLPPAGHTASAWECNKCGRQHLQAKRPKVCEKCAKHQDFREIK